MYQPNANFASAFQINVQQRAIKLHRAAAAISPSAFPWRSSTCELHVFTFLGQCLERRGRVHAGCHHLRAPGITPLLNSTCAIVFQPPCRLTFLLPARVRLGLGDHERLVAAVGHRCAERVPVQCPDLWLFTRRLCGLAAGLGSRTAPLDQQRRAREAAGRLNPDAFAMPETVRQGTEGRNDIAGIWLDAGGFITRPTLPEFESDANFSFAPTFSTC